LTDELRINKSSHSPLPEMRNIN